MKSKSKADTVGTLRRAIDAQQGAVVAEFRGLTVLEITNLRKKLRGVNAEFKVVKNTLMRLAAKETDFGQLGKFFSGPTAVALTHGDPVALAKAMKEFAGASPKVRIKAGFFYGKVLAAADVEALADVPPREVLLARLACGLASPISRMAQALSGPQRKLVYAMHSIHEKKSEQQTA
ncbi:MAG: 50S ribosomal protein L10 [Deltaproteobacteria bacterium]|nr:50S ribosomal protein L10 [Deltaproteobacteria bacterium]